MNRRVVSDYLANRIMDLQGLLCSMQFEVEACFEMLKQHRDEKKKHQALVRLAAINVFEFTTICHELAISIDKAVTELSRGGKPLPHIDKGVQKTLRDVAADLKPYRDRIAAHWYTEDDGRHFHTFNSIAYASAELSRKIEAWREVKDSFDKCRKWIHKNRNLLGPIQQVKRFKE